MRDNICFWTKVCQHPRLVLVGDYNVPSTVFNHFAYVYTFILQRKEPVWARTRTYRKSAWMCVNRNTDHGDLTPECMWTPARPQGPNRPGEASSNHVLNSFSGDAGAHQNWWTAGLYRHCLALCYVLKRSLQKGSFVSSSVLNNVTFCGSNSIPSDSLQWFSDSLCAGQSRPKDLGVSVLESCYYWWSTPTTE